MGSLEDEIKALKNIAQFHTAPAVPVNLMDTLITFYCWSPIPTGGGGYLSKVDSNVCFDTRSIPKYHHIFCGQAPARYFIQFNGLGRYATITGMFAVNEILRSDITDEISAEDYNILTGVPQEVTYNWATTSNTVVSTGYSTASVLRWMISSS